MLLSRVFEPFLKTRPVCVMARCALERLLDADRLNDVFDETAQAQYTHELLFSTLVELMSEVVLGKQPSVHAAYQSQAADIPVSVTAVYRKLDRMELGVSEALVRDSFRRAEPVVRKLRAAEASWLPGYQGAAPVRIGNAAATQYQLDVYGEVMDALHLTLTAGVDRNTRAWEVQSVLLDFLESNWQRPDEGIWEVRGPRRPFTHSKVMAWVAFDRAVKMVERFGLDGHLERWRGIRDEIHAEVCREGFDAARNTFVQYYGSKELDASLLLIPLTGFLPCEDPRVRGTVEAVESELMVDGLVLRYRTETHVDGLPAGEGVFLPCSFWLVDNLALLGRRADAVALFERLLSLCNDVGLIGEEYEVRGQRLLGNFPQALTHVALINSARNLSRPTGPLDRRVQRRP